jgi:TRAP-type C4-dicarboxylate transport system substrate-binding protein
MTIRTPDRVVELWPSLPEAARKTILDIAENTSPREVPLELSKEEERLIEQAQEDFRHGRVLTMDEFTSDMAAFVAELRQKATTAS